MATKRVMNIMLPVGYPIISENLTLREAWITMRSFTISIAEHP